MVECGYVLVSGGLGSPRELRVEEFGWDVVVSEGLVEVHDV